VEAADRARRAAEEAERALSRFRAQQAGEDPMDEDEPDDGPNAQQARPRILGRTSLLWAESERRAFVSARISQFRRESGHGCESVLCRCGEKGNGECRLISMKLLFWGRVHPS